MIEFLTLFLGAIVTGPTEVQMMVSGDVAAVEIRLDQDSLAVLRASPWRFEVDFSEELEPHVLEAIAYSKDGQELDRTRQWVNLAPQTAEIRIVLDRDPDSDAFSARLSWRSISTDSEPSQIRAFLDDKALAVIDPSSIPLPAGDPAQVHHLRVELEFPGELQASAEVTFGGAFGETVESGLTPFPVNLLTVKKLPRVEEMQGWFRVEDRPLVVHSTDKGLAEIVVVRDPEALPYLEKLLSRQYRLSSPVLVRGDQRLRLLGTRPRTQQTDQEPFELFRLSAPVSIGRDGLLAALVAEDTGESSTGEIRLAEAVATAGLSAHETGRRRAVVVITTGDAAATTGWVQPQQVRRYLARLGVPLLVWNPLAKDTETGAWGPATDISSEERLRKAYKELTRRLNRQRVIWFTGLHLPPSITLDPAVEGIELVR